MPEPVRPRGAEVLEVRRIGRPPGHGDVDEEPPEQRRALEAAPGRRSSTDALDFLAPGPTELEFISEKYRHVEHILVSASTVDAEERSVSAVVRWNSIPTRARLARRRRATIPRTADRAATSAPFDSLRVKPLVFAAAAYTHCHGKYLYLSSAGVNSETRRWPDRAR